MAVLYVEEGGARLDFIQNMQYKFVELLSLSMRVVSDEMLRAKIMFRYLDMKVCCAAVACAGTLRLPLWIMHVEPNDATTSLSTLTRQHIAPIR
jgi:hypothetical protein